MNMRSTDNPEFAIDLSDLADVFELLSDQKLVAVDDLKIRDLIITDLEKLPSTDIGPFSISFLNRQGGGSEWVSIDVGDDGMEFSVGNHCCEPGVGGDTYSETIFKCWGGGDREGYLGDWLSQLNSLDRDTMKISISHEFQEDECETDQETAFTNKEISSKIAPSPSEEPLSVSERDKLMRALRKASTDERLPSELRDKAKLHYRRLLAVANRRRIINGETGGFDGQLVILGIDRTIFHLQAGLRTFADVTRAVAADLDVSLYELRPCLRSWYNGSRDLLEDAGLDIDGMDGPEAVKGALSMIEVWEIAR